KEGDLLITLDSSSQFLPSYIFLPFSDEIKSEKISKKEALDLIFSNKKLIDNRIYNTLKSKISVVKIEKIEEKDYDGYVYDLSVPDTQVFWGGNSPILLHNSDERGIDTIREKIKERFAKTMALGEIPFKIVILDESDAMTNDAQTALRRIMEIYARNIRFILTCNYSNKIIEPVQSRTVVFRFSPLSKEDIINRLIEIAKNEKVQYTNDGLEAIFEVSGGDMRKAINLLQSTSLLGEVNQETVYKVAGAVKPKEIRAILDSIVKGKFSEAREAVIKMLYVDGIPGSDIVYYLHREIGRINVPEECKIRLIETLGDYEYRLMEGSNEEIQLSSMLARMILICKEYVK
ncbi:MAG: replication factor C small subunit, partial [Thermoproteota archaeon]